ncbi:MAG: hypothetical protein CMG11_06110, partial [Candidatus Marinimicrobia bacterium]|nr:hypothetical protein [Candidatus Neomarinimicrobiota bacterium]
MRFFLLKIFFLSSMLFSIYPPNGATDIDPTTIYFNWDNAPTGQHVVYTITVNGSNGQSMDCMTSSSITYPSWCGWSNFQYNTTYTWSLSYDYGNDGWPDGGAGPYSFSTTDNIAPSPPQDLLVSINYDEEGSDMTFNITLNWSENSEGDISHYRIYRDTSTSPTSIFEDDIENTNYLDVLDSSSIGTEFYYRITAVDNSGNESGFSNQVSVIPMFQYNGPDWYVSTSGSSNFNGSIDFPLNSIQEAINLSSNGDSIYVGDGIYNERINFNTKSITLQSINGPDNCTIDGGGGGPVVIFENNEVATLIGFTITNGNGYGGGIYCFNGAGGGPDVTLENLIISGNHANYGGGGVCSTGNASGGSITIRDSKIINNSANNYGSAIYGYYSSYDVDRVLIANNSGSGEVVYLWGSNSSFDQVTFADNNSGSSIDTYQSTSVIVSNSIIWNDAPPEDNTTVNYSNISGGYAGTGNIDLNPLFVDPDNLDYNLQLDSPCVDSGNPNYTDSDGTRIDMGAFFYDQTNGCTDSEALNYNPNSVEDDGTCLYPPPISSFSATPQSGVSPLTVQFLDTSLEQDGTIVDWLWNFGDGQTSNIQNPTHTYYENGSYTVTLTVFDDNGMEDTNSIVNYINVFGIVVNEIMKNPSAVSDTEGEWFEIINISNNQINLFGWSIKDSGSDNHIIDSNVYINPGEYLILGINNDLNSNGGISIDYEYDNFIFSNSDDEIIIVSNTGIIVDSIAYNDLEFPDPSGSSISLKNINLDNSNGINWVETDRENYYYGLGDGGTPGYPNFDPEIVLESNSITMDTTYVGSSSFKTLALYNQGNSDLIINTLENENDFFNVSLDSYTIAQGDSTFINIEFAPQYPDYSQEYFDQINLYSNDYDNPFSSISLTGFGYRPVPMIGVLNSISFPDTPEFQVSYETFYIDNWGDTTLTISDIDITNSVFNIPISSAIIEPNDTLFFDVSFSPGNHQSYLGSIDISSDSYTNSDLQVSLSGNGVRYCEIETSEELIDFGEKQVGLSKTIPMNIINSGSANNLYIDSIISNNQNFSVSSDGNFYISPQDSTEIEITFSPDDVTSFNSIMTIISNDPNQSEKNITLSGVGIETNPSFYVDTEQIDFGIIDIGQTESHAVLFRNDGLEDLEIEFMLDSDLFLLSATDMSLSYNESDTLWVNHTNTNGQLKLDYLTVTTNDPYNLEFNIPVSANMIIGCLDELALNYDSEFNVEDNSLCDYYSGPNWYVSNQGTDDIGYGSEENPFASIQHAIDNAVDGDEIYVYSGTYEESVSFQGKNISVTSISGPENTIISANNSGVCVSIESPDYESDNIAAILDGFTLTDGFSDNAGGGLYIYRQSVILSNLIVIDNNTNGNGAGIYIADANVMMDNITVSSNIGLNDDQDSSGGGVAVFGNSTVTIDNSIISDNSAVYCPGILSTNIASSTGNTLTINNTEISSNSTNLPWESGVGSGGGICLTEANVSLSNVIISDNSVLDSGGGISIFSGVDAIIENSFINNNNANQFGGGIYVNSNGSPSSVTIINSQINNNQSNNGGGIYAKIDTELIIMDSDISYNNVSETGFGGANNGGGISISESQLDISNSTISRNYASEIGGGIYAWTSYPIDLSSVAILENYSNSEAPAMYFNGGTSATINQCTVSRNGTIPQSPGIVSVYVGSVQIENSIIYSNDDAVSPIYLNSSEADVTVEYSDISGGYEGIGNIDIYPEFVELGSPDTSQEEGDYNLLPLSSCIDAGNPESVLDPDGTRADMGAFSYDQIENPIIFGCMDDMAINYNLEANNDDGTCEYYSGPTWYVSTDGTDVEGYGSEEYPFRTIQYAYTYAELNNEDGNFSGGDTIIVSDGEYAGYFNIPPELTIISMNGPENTVINANDGISFQTGFGGINQTTLSGFTITGANNNGCGGIRLGFEAQPLLENLIITNNHSIGEQENDGGGGICLDNTSAIIRNCTIQNNSSQLKGGGILLKNGASATIDNCFIDSNSAENGGGISIEGSSILLIDNSTISYNSADHNGGGLFVSDNSNLSMNNSIIDNNYITLHGMGAGLLISSGSITSISDSEIIYNNINLNGPMGEGGGLAVSHSQLDIFKTLIHSNISQKGGAIVSETSDVSIDNCTIADNIASTLWNGIFFSNGSADINNSILWSNGTHSVCLENNVNLNVSYSDFQGGVNGIAINGPYPNIQSFDAINLDPLFTDTENADYTLQSSSPCIDAADPNSELDIDGTRADIGALYYDQILNPIVWGCMDEVAANYSSEAINDDESCEYVVHTGDWYIAVDGTDDIGYGSEQFPVASISYAVSNSASMIYVNDGTYYESIVLGNSSITSINGPENTIINTSDYAFTVGDGFYGTINGFTITGNSEGIYINGNGGDTGGAGSPSPTISNMRFINCNSSNCSLISGYEVGSPTIRNCLFANNQTNCGIIGFSQMFGSATVQNCTIVNNSIDNTAVISNTSNSITVTNTIIRDNGSYSNNFGNPIYGQVGVNYSNVDGNFPVDGNTNIDVDPLFVNPGYTLQPSSPCIDAGTGTDPDGTVADMGAYYFDQIETPLVYGCLDSDACNFNSDQNVNVDNGTCIYTFDCLGECGGPAFIDDCGVCSGGTTGHESNSDMDCNGDCFGFAFVDDCGVCSGGDSGLIPNSDMDDCGACFGFNQDKDCNGDCFGIAFIDDCGVCSGGSSGYEPNNDMDCNGDCFGVAFLDECDVCSSGDSGHVADSDIDDCGVCFGLNQDKDCNGDCFGVAFLDECDVCSSGDSGHVAGSDIDCNGDCFGIAFLDECDVCSGGASG